MAEQQTPKYYCDFCRARHGAWPKPFTFDALHAHIKHEHPLEFRSRSAGRATITQSTKEKP